VPPAPPRLHHVVFCVRPEHQDGAADLWRALGLTFVEVVLDDLDLRVLIDWDAGIELVSPRPGAGPAAAAFTGFLDTRGEGVYSVVVAVAGVDGPLEVARRYGATVAYRQRRDVGAVRFDEVELEAVHGMPLTFLATSAVPADPADPAVPAEEDAGP
jgi:hypothetical protein